MRSLTTCLYIILLSAPSLSYLVRVALIDKSGNDITADPDEGEADGDPDFTIKFLTMVTALKGDLSGYDTDKLEGPNYPWAKTKDMDISFQMKYYSVDVSKSPAEFKIIKDMGFSVPTVGNKPFTVADGVEEKVTEMGMNDLVAITGTADFDESRQIYGIKLILVSKGDADKLVQSNCDGYKVIGRRALMMI